MSSIRELVSSSCNDYEREISVDGGDDDFEEESGWTMYLEDFFAKNRNDNTINRGGNNSFSIDNGTSNSLVSDAASLVLMKKKCDDDNNNCEEGNTGVGLSIGKSYSRLRFKKRKTKGSSAAPNYVVDDALEDTASSPVNSPKVYDLMNQFNKNIKQMDYSSSPSQEKGIITGSTRNPQVQVDERNEDLGFIGRESKSTELKKRGLCLVPLSMVVNYFG